jgi:GNAT superfamily N-acetyltransferase
VTRASTRGRAALACEIRPATSEDIPSLVELLSVLFAIETDFTLCPDRHVRGLRLLLRQVQRGHCAVLVAALGARVVGMATVQTVISTAEGARSGWIEDVVVAAELRGQGIGKQLMAAICDWARRHEVRRLQLLADRRNHTALAFYDRLGYARSHMVALRKPVRVREEVGRAMEP